MSLGARAQDHLPKHGIMPCFSFIFIGCMYLIKGKPLHFSLLSIKLLLYGRRRKEEYYLLYSVCVWCSRQFQHHGLITASPKAIQNYDAGLLPLMIIVFTYVI